jgi:hypothetical protein
MNIDKLSSLGSRICFAAALICLVAGVVEGVLTFFNVSIRTGYGAGHLLVLGAIFLLPVVTVLLREIRDEVRKQKHG